MTTSDFSTRVGQRAAQVGVLVLTPLMVAGVIIWAPEVLVAARRGDPAAILVALVALLTTAILIWHTLSLLAAYVALIDHAPATVRHLLRGLIRHVGTSQAKDLLYRHTAATAMATSLLTGVVPHALADEPLPEPVSTPATTVWEVPDDLAWGGPPASPARPLNSQTSTKPSTSPPMPAASPTTRPLLKASPSATPVPTVSAPTHRASDLRASTSQTPSLKPSTPPASQPQISSPSTLTELSPLGIPDLHTDKTVHVVSPGESLWSIAFDLTGSNAGAASVWPEIYRLNQQSIGDNPSLIYPGLELALPQVTP